MATARIVLRGLIAFVWDLPNERAAAVLVDRPGVGRHGRHRHIPRVSWRGMNGSEILEVGGPREFSGTLWFDWTAGNETLPTLSRGGTYDRLVPNFRSFVGRAAPVSNRRRILDGEVVDTAGETWGSIAAVVLFDAGQVEVTDVARFWRASARGQREEPPSPQWPAEYVTFVGASRLASPLAAECRLTINNEVDGARLRIHVRENVGRPAEVLTTLGGAPGACDSCVVVTVAFGAAAAAEEAAAKGATAEGVAAAVQAYVANLEESMAAAKAVAAAQDVAAYASNATTLANADPGSVAAAARSRATVLAGSTPPCTCVPGAHDLAPQEIEVLITNFSRRMAEPLPYSVHYQYFFDLLRSTTRPNTPGSDAADAVADGWYAHHPTGSSAARWGSELKDDLADVGLQYPFPVIENPRDHQGWRIRDPDDRPLCPFIGGDD